MKTQHSAAIGLFIILLVLNLTEIGAATLYVSQTSPSPAPPYATWETAARTIQEAVDAASDGDTVLAGAGEYLLTNQVSIAKAILLRSDLGQSQTIISGQRKVRCLWIGNPGAVVDGFTIEWGLALADAGGGVILVGGTVQNCTIRRCWAGSVGAGVAMFGGMLSNCVVRECGPPSSSQSAVHCVGGLITDCQIVDNGGFNQGLGTAVYLRHSELRNSVVSWNVGRYGGGVNAVSSIILGCTINNNGAYEAGGGAYLDQCEVDRCTISGNGSGYFFSTPGRGGGIYGINSVVRNSLISRNGVSDGYDRITDTDGALPGFGGGIYLRGGSVVNCTVTENNTGDGGPGQPSQAGGIYIETGTVRNSIIYFNSAPSNANWSDLAGVSFDHSCTTPDPGGVGNIVADPEFVDRTNGNYRLAPMSPCIDAGLNEAWMSGATDLDGNPRIQNATVDLGAWESIAPNAATLNIRPASSFRP